LRQSAQLLRASLNARRALAQAERLLRPARAFLRSTLARRILRDGDETGARMKSAPLKAAPESRRGDQDTAPKTAFERLEQI